MVLEDCGTELVDRGVALATEQFGPCWVLEQPNGIDFPLRVRRVVV